MIERRIGLLLSAILFTFTPRAPALTSESECTRSYQSLFEKSREPAQTESDDVRVKGTALSSATLGVCAFVFKGSGVCGGLFGGGLGATEVSAEQIQAAEQQVKDSQRIYAIYEMIEQKDYFSPPVSDLFVELEAPVHVRAILTQTVTQLLDTGAACENGKPNLTYDDFLGLLRERM